MAGRRIIVALGLPQRIKRRVWFERQIHRTMAAGKVINDRLQKDTAARLRSYSEWTMISAALSAFMQRFRKPTLSCWLLGFLVLLAAAAAAAAAHPLSGHKLLVTSIRTGDTEIF